MNNDLIPRHTVMSVLDALKEAVTVADPVRMVADAEYTLQNVKPSNAVEVVRCRDCNYSSSIDGMRIVRCHRWGKHTLANGYCHCGTRKDAEVRECCSKS